MKWFSFTTPLEERFRKDGTWQGFFKMPQHLDSPLEIDFTDIHIKEFIQRYYDNFVHKQWNC